MTASTHDAVVYLNKAPFKLSSRLRSAIEAAKIKRMPADQWLSFIKGLSGKGVKKEEMSESGLLDWLSLNRTLGAATGKAAIDKDEVLDALDRLMPTVKEVRLASPQYGGWHHGRGLPPEICEYQEILFIANSEQDNISDRIEEIEFQMEGLSFDLERLAEDPELAVRLEKERAELMRQKPHAQGFRWSHFTANSIQGRHGKNLIAHARVTIWPQSGLYFIEEVQSDWGQSGRVKKAVNEARVAQGLPTLTWNEHVPRGPFVTDTKMWAGLVLRRLLQRAAATPGINRVAWIRDCMKNGQTSNPLQVYGREVEDSDHFYMRVIPSLADSALGKSGMKTTLRSETLAGVLYEAIPGFEMTDAAREQLKGVQPLYSAANVLRNPRPMVEERLVQLMKDAREMLGSTAQIRFVEKLYNLEDLSPVSGSMVNRVVQVALNAEDVTFALDHECYHFADVHLMSMAQRDIVRSSFAPGGELNARVRNLLLRANQEKAAAQCDSAEEAAAHGFAFWAKGELDLTIRHQPVKDVFEWIGEAVVACVRWIARIADETHADTVEDVFKALRSGELAAQADRREEARRGSSVPRVA